MLSRSLTALRLELEELRKDRAAFAKAYDILCSRLLESNEIPGRRPLLHEWSGSRACVGSLEMSIHAIERTIEEHLKIIESIESGEMKNSDNEGAN